MHANTDLTHQEAFELVVREMRMHTESGRKNFALRAPQDMAVYLFAGALKQSGLSMVALECLLSEQKLSGLSGSEDGRVLRRYMSGETRMTWPIYRRLAFWVLANEWISSWGIRDLLFRTYQREAAQLSARMLLRKLKRGLRLDSLTPTYVADCFDRTYAQLLQECELDALRNVERNSGARELADALALNLQR
ncbi:hypothetical protein D3880_00580 [Pseudomonas cavernae]|uniref:Uncharacterized protein n=1 Tax=Pseudomonas cavernae TaxID=2320867 RepID=A0A385YXH3_9PSED|nr:hypothetical protein [Pseudomonas cavernae]AYC30970.1 hypothetical protein D3880_00580 [Pseudomonas cavernae]